MIYCSTITLVFSVSFRFKNTCVFFSSILRSRKCGFVYTCFHAFMPSPTSVFMWWRKMGQFSFFTVYPHWFLAWCACTTFTSYVFSHPGPPNDLPAFSSNQDVESVVLPSLLSSTLRRKPERTLRELVLFGYLTGISSSATVSDQPQICGLDMVGPAWSWIWFSWGSALVPHLSFFLLQCLPGKGV